MTSVGEIEMIAEAIAVNDVERLVIENDRLVWYLVQSFPPREREDWHGVGVIGLIKAARSFNPGLGFKFATYASKIITNEIRMELRKRRKQLLATVSLDADITDEGNAQLKDIIADPNVNFERDYTDGDEEAQRIALLHEVIKEWSARDRAIFSLYSEGKRHWEIADHIGVTQSYMSRMIAKLVKKARIGVEQKQKELTAIRRSGAGRRVWEVNDLALDQSYLDADFFDWETPIRSFAKSVDMSYRDTIRWISQRDSLQQAVELMGITTAPLRGLGEFLTRRGYKAPPMTDGGIEKYIHPKTKHRSNQKRLSVDMSSVKDRLNAERDRAETSLVIRQATPEELAKYKNPTASSVSIHQSEAKVNKEPTKPQTKERGEIKVGLGLTKEEYLQNRASGMTKAQIARERGVKSPTLTYWIEKWGLKDPAVEQVEIGRITGFPQPVAIEDRVGDQRYDQPIASRH